MKVVHRKLERLEPAARETEVNRLKAQIFQGKGTGELELLVSSIYCDTTLLLHAGHKKARWKLKKKENIRELIFQNI